MNITMIFWPSKIETFTYHFSEFLFLVLLTCTERTREGKTKEVQEKMRKIRKESKKKR